MAAYTGVAGWLLFSYDGQAYFLRSQITKLPGISCPKRWAGELKVANLQAKTLAQGVEVQRRRGGRAVAAIHLSNKTKLVPAKVWLLSLVVSTAQTRLFWFLTCCLASGRRCTCS
eukprot:SAG25_NODE_354_length_9250_cov_2.824281_2_plen_115_part_00